MMTTKKEEIRMPLLSIEDDMVLHCLEKHEDVKNVLEAFVGKIRLRVEELIADQTLREITLVKTNIHCCLMLMFKRNISYMQFREEFKTIERIYFETIEELIDDKERKADIIEQFVIDHECA